MPGDKGITLGIDLWELYRAGTQSLADVATEYDLAYSDVKAAGELTERAFRRPEVFGGGAPGPAFEPWMDLMRATAGFLEETTKNLDATGEALVLAANTYAETDRAASRTLKRLIREHHTRWGE